MIEEVGADAADELARLHQRGFAAPWTAAEFARLMETPSAFALIAPHRGFVLGWAPGGDAEILTLAVALEARRAGVGAALVEAAAAAALVRGASSLSLEVAADNSAARALYRKLGFVESGRRPRYYASGADALLLRRELVKAGV